MTRDWFDYAGFVFNILATSAGVVGLFLAVKAYKVAKAAGKTAFELEILREMAYVLEDRGKRAEMMDRMREHPGDALHEAGLFARMVLIAPRTDLTLWWVVAKSNLLSHVFESLHTHPALEAFRQKDKLEDLYDEMTFVKSLVIGMRTELLDAMEKRTK
ncbi:hypothetical protein ABZ570_09560 [Micromonospora sp. NPDC007271]|uniref:hypothetical protein n=1 Tax=Micromonospora sp. NPDC007271 TaxID=3154587 RepID=UPI0033DB6050